MMFVGPREQVNQLTSFLDASQVYGSSLKEALELRELTVGKFRRLRQTVDFVSWQTGSLAFLVLQIQIAFTSRL